MTIQELRKKYTEYELCHFPGNMELRYEAFAPLFENLHENKMIYYEKGVGWLICVKNFEITPQGFSATAIPICVLFNNNRMNLGGSSLLKEWKFSATWSWMLLCDDNSFAIPYASFSIWIEADIIREVEKLIAENKIEETYNIIGNMYK